MPCDLVKEKYTEFELTSGVIFSDEVVFDRILKFYQKRTADKKYDLAKKAIYLICYRHSLSKEHEGDAPYAKLLSDYISQWKWEEMITQNL